MIQSIACVWPLALTKLKVCVGVCGCVGVGVCRCVWVCVGVRAHVCDHT